MASSDFKFKVQLTSWKWWIIKYSVSSRVKYSEWDVTVNGTQEHKNNNFKVFVLKFHFFYDINILGCICKYIWHRKNINHFYFKTISECFLSKTIKNRVFLFYKLRNHVQDLSSHQDKKEKYKFLWSLIIFVYIW